MQIRRNGLNKLKTFLTNILKNISWHLFAGESHQVVKITVPYCPYEYSRNRYDGLSNYPHKNSRVKGLMHLLGCVARLPTAQILRCFVSSATGQEK